VKITTIYATDIPDAWFQCVSSILENGFKYVIEHGSFIGQTRMEFDFVVVHIRHPYAEPYDMMLPQIPVHLNIPNPVANGYVEQYAPYLMTGEKLEGEDYTYGERICKAPVPASHIRSDKMEYINQVDYWINVLKTTPNTNQAVLQVGAPSDCLLADPPCLRHIDMRIKDGKLIFYPYFRSWDLWGGFPANLAGIAVLQQFMADQIGVESGDIIASSKGLHLYGYVEELAKIRTNK
jgi:thymidylate synthase